MPSLLNFVNSVSQTNDMQDVSTQIVGGKADHWAPREGRPTAPTLPWLLACIGPSLKWCGIGGGRTPVPSSNLGVGNSSQINADETIVL